MTYYLCKVNLIDPSTDKVTKTQILVESTGVTESEAKVTEHLQGAGEAFEVTDVTKTRIESVLKNND